MQNLDLDLPVAELELYGLSTRTISMLENRCGVVYVRHILGVKAGLRAALGPAGYAELCRSVRNYRAGRAITTAAACLASFGGRGYRLRQAAIRRRKERLGIR